MEDLLLRVRLEVLRQALETTHVPTAGEVASELGVPEADAVDAYRQLGEGHVYVVEPGDPTRLRMANPFSGRPTRFTVSARGRSYFANCVWDSLGIVSLLGGDGVVETVCPDCGDKLTLKVADRKLVESDGVVHFSVPARHWWDDIVFS
jgi:hypothetical protein